MATPLAGTALTGQEDLVHNLEQALTTHGVPSDIVNMVLNLAEFMEHDDKPLALEARLLGDYVSASPPNRESSLTLAGHHIPRICESAPLQRDGVFR